MAGALFERELNATDISRARFSVASPSDNAGICRLLRENPMLGPISLSLEREPDYFADANLFGETKSTIVAHENGRVICAGSCTLRQRFVNGVPKRVGYLGGLRLDATHAGRFDILRRGYKFFRELQADEPADFYFTSIAASNERARNFLERDLPGMPRYEFLTEYVTLLISARAKGHQVLSESEASDASITRLNDHNRRYQFSPVWSNNDLAALKSLGLHDEDFRSIRKQGEVIASAALWNQRDYKQTVVRRYSPWLSLSRPVVNLFAAIAGNPRLPAPRETIRNVFVSHLTVASDQALVLLLKGLRHLAAQRGDALLTLGFAANDPRLSSVRKAFHCREYHSRSYLVSWPGIGGTAHELDDRLLAPEVALL